MSVGNLPDNAVEEKHWESVSVALATKDYDRAIEVLQELARLDDTRAFASLGYVFEAKGFLDRSNYKRAAAWYGKALEHEEIPAVHLGLARYYFYGLGGTKDERLAVLHLESSMADESPEAATMLAYLYHKGQHVPRDIPRAKKLFEVGAAAGYPFATKSLSNIYWSEHRPMMALKLQLRGILQLARLRAEGIQDARLIGFSPLLDANAPDGGSTSDNS